MAWDIVNFVTPPPPSPEVCWLVCMELMLKYFVSLLFCFWRNNHSPHHDHPEHQRTAFFAQSVLCYCHGLVHSCLLCFRIFRPYWVCCCQLFYQYSNGKSQKEVIESPPGNTGCSCAEREASRSSSAGIWLHLLQFQIAAFWSDLHCQGKNWEFENPDNNL